MHRWYILELYIHTYHVSSTESITHAHWEWLIIVCIALTNYQVAHIKFNPVQQNVLKHKVCMYGG